MAISNFGWAWKGPQIFQLLPALTFPREASSLLQPAFTFPSVTFHSRCPDGPQRVSPHWLGWCPSPALGLGLLQENRLPHWALQKLCPEGRRLQAA